MNWPDSDFLFRANLGRYKEVSIYWKRIVIMKSWKETSFTTFFAHPIGRAHKYFWKLPMICQHREHSFWETLYLIDTFLSSFWFNSEKVIRVTPEVEAHLAFLRGLEKRGDIKVNTDHALKTAINRSLILQEVSCFQTWRITDWIEKKIEKAFCRNVSVLFYTIVSLTCKQCRFTNGR